MNKTKKTLELVARAEELEREISSSEQIEIEDYDGEIWISRYSEERGGAEGIERFCFRNQIDPKKLRHACNINNWFYVL